MSAKAPRVRALDAFPVEHEGQSGIGLRDPERLTDAVIVVPPPLYFLLAHMDGTRSFVDLQVEFNRQFGEIPRTEELSTLCDQLDALYFLEGPRLDAHRLHIEEAFRASPTRPAMNAGCSYPHEPDTLASHLDALWEAPGGPGRPGTQASLPPGQRLVGLVAPHIDIPRGGIAYAHAYRAVAEAAADVDLFVVFGTSHQPMREPFCLTEKDYETPLGALPTDRSFVQQIAASVDGQIDPFADEWRHRAEHSIEFQMVWLRHVTAGRNVHVVPILCGSFHEHVEQRQDPAQASAPVARLLEAVRETLARDGRRACLVAGADLAHIGLRFGDPLPPDGPWLAHVEQDDRRALEAATRGDARGFFDAIADIEDRNRVCGLSPIYALLSCIPGRQGELLRYEQYVDREHSVSFASLAFWEG